jgi:molybdopterin-guanine dinucleotide biosynthesis protein A
VITRDRITLGILAGGQARRLGGADKAFVPLEGQALLSRTLAALGTGYADVLVSYNGSDFRVREYPVAVVPDLRADFPGPMAGIESLLQATGSEWLLTVPVDLRDVPLGVAESLCNELASDPTANGVNILDADGLQPLLALWRVSAAREAATAALDAGEGAVHRLQRSLQFRSHDISPCRLGNLNTPDDFE